MFVRMMALGATAKRATKLSWFGVGWLLVALGTVAGAFLTLSVAAEDVVGHDGLAVEDPTGLSWFIQHRGPVVVDVARIATTVGSVPALLLLIGLGGLVLWRRGQPLVVALAPAIAFGCAGASVALAKVVFGRPRPPVGLHLVVENEPSFPSGHATDSTAVFLALGLVGAICVLRSPRGRAAVVAAAMALAGAVGLSRLTLGVHWPSDVIAGWALGTVTAVTVSTAAVLIARVDGVNTPGLLHRAHQLALCRRRQGRATPVHPAIATVVNRRPQVVPSAVAGSGMMSPARLTTVPGRNSA